MQQLFQTLKLDQSKQSSATENNPQSQLPQPTDFNTMQNMFQTTNPPINPQQLPNIQDFSTMQMLFQTQNAHNSDMKPNNPMPNPNDFRTIGNLCKTMNPSNPSELNSLNHSG